MKHALPILGLLSCALTAAAADRWTAVQSKNFFLVGNASESQIRDVAENLEIFRTSYSKFFSVRDSAPSVGTTVVVFKTDSAFRPFKPLYRGKPANIAGYYQSGQDMNFIALSADLETPRVIYHEYVHSLMSDNLASLPPWFQEGFAECFSTLEIEGSRKIRIGRAIAEHVALLNERRFMPLERLFAVTHESPEYNEEEKQGVFYAESWALVHYMMLGPQDRRAKFFEFLDELNKGVAATTAFERVFQTSLASFQKVFEAYIQQRLAWPAMELSGTLDRNKDMTAKVLSEAESATYMGDILMRSDRFPEAETHLKNALRLNPMLASAQAAMGRLLLRQEKDDDAAGYFQRAIELDPADHLTRYYYASAIQGRNRTISDADWKLARSELLKAVQLAPHFVTATEMLANLNLLRNAEIPQTVELLRKARTYAPGNENLAVMMAFALAQTPERDAARDMAEALLRRGSLSAPMRRNAESVLRYLNQTAANANQARTLTGASSSNILPAGAARVRGILTILDCEDGVTLTLVVDGRTLKFHSATRNGVQFAASNPALAPSIACGPLPGNGIPAAVVYRPQESADNVGEPLIVEIEEQRGGISNSR